MVHFAYEKTNPKLNLIQRQADDFLLLADEITRLGYTSFIEDVRLRLYDYHKDIHKIQFLERLIIRFKIDFDNHMEVCSVTPKSECLENQIFEHVIFFLQEEMDELDENLDSKYFNENYRESLNSGIQEISERLQRVEGGQEVTYNDIMEELEDLKNLYFLSKKNWVEMFIGKFSSMVAGGMISETVSKELIEYIKINYPDLIG